MLPLRRLHSALSSKVLPENVCLLKAPSNCSRLHTSHHPSDFPLLINQPSAEHQIYQSSSTDPYVNLSIENHLYKYTPNDSKVLFLYVNRPTVVIGRNQNPWLETNLHLLNGNHIQSAGEPIALLRRRSGGGAVFHDEGNLNFSVICPKPIFHRDKHAEMVVRALHRLGAHKTSVNTRHDIVMSQNPSAPSPPPRKVVQLDTDDAESPRVETTPSALKISGSAYKLSRFRALHHGTCLVDSPNLNSIGAFLRSPARPYLQAKGVESVRSPIGNISSALDSFPKTYLMQALIDNIIQEFAVLYNVDTEAVDSAHGLQTETGFRSGSNWVVGTVSDTTSTGVTEIEDDIREFKSLDWTYNQCPQFTFSSHSTEEDPRLRPDLPAYLNPSTRIFLRFKSGKVIESQISTSDDIENSNFQSRLIHDVLREKSLHEIRDWKPLLNGVAHAFSSPQDLLKIAEWLNHTLGR